MPEISKDIFSGGHEHPIKRMAHGRFSLSRRHKNRNIYIAGNVPIRRPPADSSSRKSQYPSQNPPAIAVPERQRTDSVHGTGRLQEDSVIRLYEVQKEISYDKSGKKSRARIPFRFLFG